MSTVNLKEETIVVSFPTHYASDIAPNFSSDARGWAVTPEDTTFTDSLGNAGFSALHHATKAEANAVVVTVAKSDAKGWAMTDEDVEFTDSDGTTGYSAFHWAQKAEGLVSIGAHASNHVDGSDDIQSATSLQKGLATAAQIAKLDGIYEGATANSTDAVLKSRANHTGAQPASTISDFDTEVANNTAVAANTAKLAGIATGADVTAENETSHADVLVDADIGLTVASQNHNHSGIYVETETDPVFTAWDKSTGISIPASQVSDFDTEVANNSAVTANTAKTGVTTQISNVIEDTTPQLGGNLDAGGHSIIDCPVNRQALGTVTTTQTLDCSTYNWFALEPTADITINLNNVVAGTSVVVELVGAGDHTLTWQLSGTTSRITWDGGSEPAWATGTTKSVGFFAGYAAGYAFGKMVFGEV